MPGGGIRGEGTEDHWPINLVGCYAGELFRGENPKLENCPHKSGFHRFSPQHFQIDLQKFMMTLFKSFAQNFRNFLPTFQKSGDNCSA